MDIRIRDILVIKDNLYLDGEGSKVLITKGHKVNVLRLSGDRKEALVKDLDKPVYGHGVWWVPVELLIKKEGTDCNNNYDQHYQGNVEPIELMQAQMTQAELIGFLKGNIIKYATRCGKKDDPAKEVSKIKRYADWLLDVLEGRKIDPRR